MTEEIDTRGYRPAVGAVLRRADGLLLMAERIDLADVWQFPQGGVEPGESHEEALWRELGEELGLEAPREACAIVGRARPTRYEYPPTVSDELSARFRGQEQVMYLLDFHGVDEDFQLDAHEIPEFKRVRWCTLEEARATIWSVKSELLEALARDVPVLARLVASPSTPPPL